MESLALFVAVLFLIDILAGPIAIFLTWGRLVKGINSQSKSAALVLTTIRRIVHGLFVTVGVFIGGWLTYIAVTPAKLFGLFSLFTSYIALRREYFPNIYILRNLSTLLGINKMDIPGIKPKELPPVFSADGTEIIRAKKIKRMGGTSGRDGHGPGGQH